MSNRVIITPPAGLDREATYKALMDALPDKPQTCAHYVVVYDPTRREEAEVVQEFCENEAGWVDNCGAALIMEPLIQGLRVSNYIDTMSDTEKVLALEYFAGSDPAGFAEAAAQARWRARGARD